MYWHTTPPRLPATDWSIRTQKDCSGHLIARADGLLKQALADKQGQPNLPAENCGRRIKQHQRNTEHKGNTQNKLGVDNIWLYM